MGPNIGVKSTYPFKHLICQNLNQIIDLIVYIAYLITEFRNYVYKFR